MKLHVDVRELIASLSVNCMKNCNGNTFAKSFERLYLATAERENCPGRQRDIVNRLVNRRFSNITALWSLLGVNAFSLSEI